MEIFIRLKNLIDDIGPDASRFYYLSKQADQHLDFDIGMLDLTLKIIFIITSNMRMQESAL